MPEEREGDARRNIVLFSDGTGNSASKPFKTNVWRTYQALDISSPPDGERGQIAFYKDGVGTETFKPLALLCGAFGFGVMRDVRSLYTYLCRNYREGDRIYAFGFSRGAFTIRLLVGLVERCGLVRADDENGLSHAVDSAYAAYRREFLTKTAKKRGTIYRHLLAPPVYVPGTGERHIELHRPVVRPNIRFLGLWDTVDAYGMPIDELKQAIDEWLWPMSLADRRLSPIVERAFHALSLDDERPTFRPLLWDQSRAEDERRIQQVWFAGVHANVGGGYPIDDLSYVPLVWMLDRAKGAGLRFDEVQLAFYRANQNVNGTAYDSRSGVAGYYRYGPRSLEKLCNDARNAVRIDEPAIHESVCERIACRQRRYAPLSVPRALALPKPGSDERVEQDRTLVDLTWDAVFWRRVVYFAIVALTLAILVLPLSLHPGVGDRSALVGFMPLPSPWIVPYVEAAVLWPKSCSILVALLVGLFVESRRLQRWIEDRSDMAWSVLKGRPPPVQPTGTMDRLVRRLRMSPTAGGFARRYEESLPVLLGPLLLGLTIAILSLGPVLFMELRDGALHLALLTSLAATAFVSLKNARFRNDILCRLREDDLEPAGPPEGRWTCTAEDWQAFKTRAASKRYPDGRTVLEIYYGPLLLPNKVTSAVCLGALIATSGRELALCYDGFACAAFHASAILGVLYAVTEVVHCMVLGRILALSQVPPQTIRLANWVWRVKTALLAASGSGIFFYSLLHAVGLRVRPTAAARF